MLACIYFIAMEREDGKSFVGETGQKRNVIDLR
jgi:hypothetical protein